MARERLYLFDTTLRDGAQTNGVDFTLADKLTIARMLDELGIDYVEGGYPGANPIDTDFSEKRPLRAKLTAFGMTRRPGVGVERSGSRGVARRQGRCHLLRRQVLGLSRARRAGDDGRGEHRLDPRFGARRQGQWPRSLARLNISSTAIRPSLLSRSPAPRRPTRKARAGWCCATPTAARCRMRSSRSSTRSVRKFPATMSASMPITTPNRRWRIPLPRCAPARAKSKARSTGSASVAATPISSPSSRR